MSIPKIVEKEEILKYCHDGLKLIAGGFNYAGNAFMLNDMIASSGIKDVHLYSQGTVQKGTPFFDMVMSGRVTCFEASTINWNLFKTDAYKDGKVKALPMSQGTMFERLRCGGYGLGGFLTPVGLGTELAEGKQVINIDGKDYLLEKPFRGDLATVHAAKADKYGNLVFKGATKAFNNAVCFAADVVFAEVEEIVEVGELTPDEIDVPGCVVDFLVKAGPTGNRLDSKIHNEVHQKIAQRAVKLIKPGDVVNLGVGIPIEMVKYAPEGVMFQCEDGLLGYGNVNNDADYHYVDAGGRTVEMLPGSSSVDGGVSFGFIRGGFLDFTFLGCFQVDEEGHMANWCLPGVRRSGPGGAMDLLYGAKQTVVCMEHLAKNGDKRILKKCTFPINGLTKVAYVVTDLCTIEVVDEGLKLIELADGVSLDEVLEKTEARLIIPDEFRK